MKVWSPTAYLQVESSHKWGSQCCSITAILQDSGPAMVFAAWGFCTPSPLQGEPGGSCGIVGGKKIREDGSLLILRARDVSTALHHMIRDLPILW